ncbi:MAG: TIM barrel protein, partial [Alcaligenaceae bacterium]|nr:TIM barrel protein [Alcaligenaceae bacterium]
MIPAANLTLLYGRLPLEDCFSAAREDGFRAVEIQFPYDHPPQWYAGQLNDNDLQLVLVNTPKDPENAPWGRAALPGQQDAFRRDFAQAAELCAATGCAAVHVMAGLVAPEQAAAARDTL